MTFVLTIIVIAIAMLTLPIGYLYKEIQQKKNNPKFNNQEFVHKYTRILNIITICAAFITLYLLYFN